jgi:4-hydroxy-3-polyprenylbenzoate decarboxylase
MKDVVKWLKEYANLKVIDEPLDVELEIPHIAYIEVKKSNSCPLLFTKPINRAKDIEYDMPVLMNIFANKETTQKIFDKAPDDIAAQIDELLKMKPPADFMGKVNMVGKLFNLKNVFPKKLKFRGECQDVVIPKSEVDLDKLPILKTWSEDGDPFITMGQVYTKSLDGTMQNLGMYRLQQYDKTSLGMHWQIHKDASSFFDQYRDANKRMPVTVAIGGDPLYIWCGQAPLPYGIFELLLYGLIRNKNPELVKSLTNDIYIPRDVDIVIEGFVDPSKLKIEGPFGDHTGYYTLKEPYPVMEVETITMQKNPLFQATVVGKPPLEDKYMGWATERIFLPLLKTTAPELIDYYMPENGVFHNLILAKMKVRYKGHAKQFMHAFWGVGQMSFVKHALFVNEDAPELEEDWEVAKYILNRLTKENILITQGIIDALDHASSETLVGGKLGIDATNDPLDETYQLQEPLSDEELYKKIAAIDSSVKSLKQYMCETMNPITVITVEKSASQKELIAKLAELKDHIKILIIVDAHTNFVDNPYMLVWRVANNIDAARDIILEPFIAVDATNKSEVDHYMREWPKDTLCDKATLDNLQAKGLIDIDEAFINRFGLL